MPVYICQGCGAIWYGWGNKGICRKCGGRLKLVEKRKETKN